MSPRTHESQPGNATRSALAGFHALHQVHHQMPSASEPPERPSTARAGREVTPHRGATRVEAKTVHSMPGRRQPVGVVRPGSA